MDTGGAQLITVLRLLSCSQTLSAGGGGRDWIAMCLRGRLGLSPSPIPNVSVSK